MIHFTCEHCRKSVRVDDRHGGLKGRCPHCQQTIAIPPADDMAAALGQAEAGVYDTGPAWAAPPPLAGKGPTHQEISLPAEGNADLADTVILPAGIFSEKEADPSAARPRQPVDTTVLDHHRPALNIVRAILVLVAIIVVLVVAVVGYALAMRRF